MPSLPPVRALALWAALVPLCACHRADDPGQVENLQLLATALRARDRRVACAVNVRALQNPTTCDAVLGPLLHFCPGFPGSRVARRGHSVPMGGGLLMRFRRPAEVRVPIRYEGPDGSGEIDVIMRRELSEWRVVALLPVGRR